jgi:hypothetical protein
MKKVQQRMCCETAKIHDGRVWRPKNLWLQLGNGLGYSEIRRNFANLNGKKTHEY